MISAIYKENIMGRQITNVAGICKALHLTRWQVYHLVGRKNDPLPHRKIGKQLRFDIERCLKWFDSQPGRGS